MKLNIIRILTSLLLALFLLISTVKITLNFRPLYYFDINYLKITEIANMDKQDIKNNYDVLIDYLSSTNKNELEFPSLSMSEQGRIHFVDVKNIFVFLDYVMYIALALALIGIYFLYKQKDYLFYKTTAWFLLGLPIFLIIPFLINFNYVFTLFHEIAFTNDYWLFNPDTDPIINLLPQKFFMHCALFILLIITIESFLLQFLYRYNVKKFVNRK